MRAILVALAVAVLCMPQAANAEEVFGPDAVEAAVTADVSEAEAFAPVAAPVIETNLSEGVIVVDLPYYKEVLTDGLIFLAEQGWKLVFIFGVGWILKKTMGAERAKQAMEALAVGVDYAWDNIGREWKHAAKDGKYTSDEKQKLRNKAIEHAKNIAGDAIKKLLAGMGQSAIESKVTTIVQKRKAIASVGKTNAVANGAA